MEQALDYDCWMGADEDEGDATIANTSLDEELPSMPAGPLRTDMDESMDAQAAAQRNVAVDTSAAATASSSTTTIQQLLDRPIVVGYAFGPKKMSTMGVVMAEASKAKLSAALEMRCHQHQIPSSSSDYHHTTNAAIISGELSPMAAPPVSSVGGNTMWSSASSSGGADPTAAREDSSPFPVPQSRQILASSASHLEDGNAAEQPPAQKSFVFTMDLLNGTDSGVAGSGLQNIVRHFRSSCSSVGSVSTAVTANSTVTTKTKASARSFASGSTSFNNKQPSTTTTRKEQQQQEEEDEQQRIPIRVSFVPLDPDMPIEDQHGGKMDIILHKLTEDILCLSQMATSRSTESELEPIVAEPDAQQSAAVRRVRRLTHFQREHPECSLVDNPDAVQTLMSRADIAEKLRTCLRDVTTVSGIPVRSPAYAVIGREGGRLPPSEIEDKVAQLRFPMIVKPLVAAGSKASHAMTVLMDRSALPTVAEKAPCLCQEYSNHDAVLHKVYVLGEYVSVHKRRSLPNLPCDQPSSRSFVEFDSQRPYPRLREFGFDEEQAAARIVRKKRSRHTEGENNNHSSSLCSSVSSPSSNTNNGSRPIHVTTEEVKPIVDALKEAFGLELFGFDILVIPATRNSNDVDSSNSDRQMLVVDVNYFPSYKEVSNFPSLLAKYLTDRAVENRRKATNSQPPPA